MPGDIEFLSPDVGDPNHPAPEPRPRSTIWAARCLVIALAVGVLVAWVAARPGSGRKTAQPPSSATPTSSAAPTPLVAPFRRVESGPGVTMCAAEVSDLAGLSAAVRKNLPGIALDGSSSLTCGEGDGAGRQVVFESVSGTYRRIEIEVDLTVRHTNSAGTAVTAPLPARGGKPLVGSAQSESAGIIVSVNAYARSGTPAPMRRLRALAEYLSLYLVL